MSDTTINTLEEPGEYDGLVKLRPGEPYFPLLGRDLFAPAVITIWADFRRTWVRERFEAGEIDQAKRDDKLRQCRQAEEIAWAMDEYRKGTLPVAPVEDKRPKVAKTNRTPEQVARDDEAKARADAGRALNNAIASIADAIGLMAIYDFNLTLALEVTIGGLRNLHDVAIPPRPALQKAQPDTAPDPIMPELIDLSDIPEAGEEFFEAATLREPIAPAMTENRVEPVPCPDLPLGQQP